MHASETVIQIPAELFAVAESSHFEGKAVLDMLNIGPDTYTFTTPVDWDIEITNTGAAFLVMGHAHAVAECACSRCLEPVELHLDGVIEGYFITEDQERVEQSDDDDDAPGEDEFEVLPDDHRIDLLPLIEAALIIEMPTMPLCKEDCAGLCSNCGANLNEGDCGCAEKVAREHEALSPFAKLADYRFTDN